ncbi:MAG: hypothetical protein U0232_27115 [Thermomicrobiales bacterium]
MFRYLSRLYDVYRREIVSLAVLGDTSPRWRQTLSAISDSAVPFR